MPRKPETPATDIDLAAMRRTKEAVAADPAAGRGSFMTVTVWENGARATTRARGFSVGTDEPAPLGGTDAAMDPMELLLAALGSCLTIGWATQARLRGVTFRDLKVSVEAPYDLRGFLSVDASVRPGFGELSYRIDVDCDADPVTIAEIKAAAEKTSPLFDNICNATPIRGTVTRRGG
jgi:uncharacterized OsmC-like protein